MANYQIAFDNHDTRLGIYFEQSKSDLVSYINVHDNNPIINEIPSPQCNQAYIDIVIPQVNRRNFVFVAYSHGMANDLLANNSFYVRSGVNSNLFTNSFFYSMSCHCGKNLGNAVVADGCHGFIGYSDIAWAPPYQYMQLFIECDNFGIKCFMLGSTLEEAFNAMKSNFNNQIDALEKQGEILYANYLRKNRDALVMFGNGALTFNGF